MIPNLMVTVSVGLFRCKGHRQIQHTGGLIETCSVMQFTLIPDINLGIVVLTNQQQGFAFNTITNTFERFFFGN